MGNFGLAPGGLAGKLALGFKSWTETLEAGQKFAIAAAPIFVWVATFTMGGVFTPAVPAVSPVNQFLEIEMARHRGPLPNAIVLWRYPDNLRTRTYVGSASTYLSKTIFEEINGVSLSMDGWRGQLLSHEDGKTHVLFKSDYGPGHPIRQAMNRGGIDQLISAPVRKNSTLLGYVSSGFAEPLEGDELALVKSQLQETAILARAHL